MNRFVRELRFHCTGNLHTELTSMMRISALLSGGSVNNVLRVLTILLTLWAFILIFPFLLPLSFLLDEYKAMVEV
jgi:hypothetical protein